MSTRFPDTLQGVLDVADQVGPQTRLTNPEAGTVTAPAGGGRSPDAGSASDAGSSADAGPAPDAGSPSAGTQWALRGVVDPMDTSALGDPDVRAAGRIVRNSQTRFNLYNELTRMNAEGVSIELEVFHSPGDLLARLDELEGIVRGEGDDDGVTYGYATPRKERGTFLFDKGKNGRPRGFHVLILPKPEPLRKGTVDLIVGNPEDTAVEISAMFRRLHCAMTLYHELLHTYWIYRRNSPDDYSVSTTSDGTQVEQALNTGHGAAHWRIDSRTLQLTARGDFDKNFFAIVSDFVNETVAKNKLQDIADRIRSGVRAGTTP